MPPIASYATHLVCTGQVLAPDAAALLRLLLLAPLLEEWVVRAGLQEWCIRHSRQDVPPRWLVPAAVPALAFGLLHAGAGGWAVLRVLAPGVLMGLLYQYSRDWRQCALLHGGLNALALGACNL